MANSRISNLNDFIFDHMNSVLLREFRQLSRSRIVFTIIFLSLAVFLITSGIYIMTTMSQISKGNAALEHGNTLFNLLSTMLILATFTFVPLYTGIRFGLERRKGKQDLMYTSSIPPWHIIFGKTMTAAQLTTLIFSLALPFLSFTYLLRGVDLGNAALNITVLFIGAVLGSQLILLFVAIPMHIALRITITVLFLLPTVFSYYIIASIALLWSGGVKVLLASAFNSYGFFSILSFVVIIIAIVSGGLFTTTSAIIAPPSSNRALPIRLYNSIATIVFLLSGMICLRKTNLMENLVIISIFLLVLACIALVASSAENDDRSLRVQRTIPQSGFKRLLLFPLYQGRFNGIVWSLGGILVLSTIITTAIVMDGESLKDVVAIVSSAILYTLGYTLVGIFIQRKLFARRFKTTITPIIIGIIFIIMVVAPFLFAFFTGNLTDMDEVWSMFSPFDGSYLNHILAHFSGGLILTVGGLILNFRCFIKSITSFKPLQLKKSEVKKYESAKVS